MDDINNFLKGAGKALETAPKLYDDAIKPTAQESGKLVGKIPRAINAALAPFEKWILHREYSVAETKKLLERKLENIEADKIVSPEPYIAVPTMQAISYAMDSPELRELYANMLAKAMNTDYKEKVHPSFVEIIKNLSPIDIRVFDSIVNTELRPLISINQTTTGNGMIPMIRHISWLDFEDAETICSSLDNLTRLGFIHIPEGTHYKNDIAYDSVINNPRYKEAYRSSEKSLLQGHSITIEKKVILINDLGNAFHDICAVN